MSEKVRIETQDENVTETSVEQEEQLGAARQTQSHDQELKAAQGEQDREELLNKLKASEDQANEYYDRLLRLSAEFENFKKRTSREMQDVVKYANEKLLKELLTVIDNLERAVNAAQPQDGDQQDPLLQGVNLTLSEVLKILQRHKVTPIESLGQPFDPNFHQAMMQEEVNDQPANTVSREMQKGYMIHDRLLRPALVAVSKAASKPEQDIQQ